MNIGKRLKSERLRLGMSQAVLGEIGGVAGNAQGQYEHGNRSPRADYLELIALAGADVLYIVTGKRSENGNVDTFKAAQALDSATDCLEKAKDLIR